MDSDQSQPFPFLMFKQSVPDTHLTITSVHKGKQLTLPGNVLLLLLRKMVQNAIDQTIEPAVRVETSQSAVSSCDITIESAQDWVRYEGIFDGLRKRPAQPLPANGPFEGVVRIPLNSHEETTAKFKFKVTPAGKFLYAYVNDPKLIQHMTSVFGQTGYASEGQQGLSYRGMTYIISRFKQAESLLDQQIAQQQLALLRGPLPGTSSTMLDRYLAFFNAVLFGAEASRNTMSFLTSVLVLELIVAGVLTYDSAFQCPSWSDLARQSCQLAANPMSTSFSGSGNFLQYMDLLNYTEEELKSKVVGSIEVDMTISREFPVWSQIQLKEAVLLRYCYT